MQSASLFAMQTKVKQRHDPELLDMPWADEQYLCNL